MFNITKSHFERQQTAVDPLAIEKFPKEFKKQFLSWIDLRFAFILLVTAVFHFFLIIYLEKKYPEQLYDDTITKVQQQYVDLLMTRELLIPEREVVTELRKDTEPLDYETITSLSEWMSRVSEGALESIRDIPGFAMDASGSRAGSLDETQVPSREEMSGARRTAADARVLTRAELESEMSSVGLLGLISSRAGTAMMDYEYIDDLLEYADLNAEQLESVLSKLSSIQVPRHNTAGYILSYKRGADVAGGNIKGGRKLAENDIENAIKDIEPLETARTTTSKRTLEYEEIPSTPLAKLQMTKEIPKMRNPEDVVRIVQSHKLALQDCYKQELKTNPEVKGKIIVRFTVNPEGSVVDASIVSSTLDSPAMGECIINRIQNWRNFPICDPSVGNITYKQVFNFGI